MANSIHSWRRLPKGGNRHKANSLEVTCCLSVNSNHKTWAQFITLYFLDQMVNQNCGVPVNQKQIMVWSFEN